MLEAWILLFLLVSGGRTFMIHNSQHSLCLEDSVDTGEVLLKECNLDSELQQWVWISQGRLMCLASSRCLSAHKTGPVHTQTCQGPDVDAAGLMWECDSNRLISRSLSMLLSTNRQRPVLTKHSKLSKWRSLDEGDICQERLRLRRASDDPDPSDKAEDSGGEESTLTKEQREYLRWYYRTEDPTIWTFVLLGLAFVCLLIGFLLLGMGSVANKSRKKIAKYKAAALLVKKNEDEDLRVLSALQDNGTARLLQGHKPPRAEGDLSEDTAGNIMVTWKDGNTSCLYSDSPAEVRQEDQEQEEKQTEVLDDDQEAHDEVKTYEEENSLTHSL